MNTRSPDRAASTPAVRRIKAPLALAIAAAATLAAPATAQSDRTDVGYYSSDYWSNSPQENRDRWSGQTNRDFDEDLDGWETEGYSYYSSNYWNQVGNGDDDWQRQYDDNQWNSRETNQWRRDASQRGDDQYRSSSQGQSGEAVLSGRVSQVQRSLRDVQGHALFRVRTAEGQSRILAVDPQDVSKLRMKQGERVEIKGRRAMIGDQQVLKVSEISKQGRTERMSDAQSQRFTSDSRADQYYMTNRQGQQGQQTISGRLADVQRAARQVEGHTLYRVRMDNGQTRVLALEPEQASRLRMNEGDRIQIRGKQHTLENKRVFKVADIKTRSAQSGWQGDDQPTGQQALSGRLVNVERANRPVEGHTLYRVRMDNGQSRILALEPGQASRLRMNEGDRVRIRGTNDMVRNQRVLKVSDIKQDHRTQSDQTGWRQGDTQSDRQSGQTGWRSQSGQTALDGRLSSVERSIREVQGYALFRVRMDDGRTQILAIEPDKASRLRMTQGERIQIKGERASIGDQQVIKVSEIKKTGSN